jgi:uncharacterized protein YndB with AHSA1/START domain
MAPIVNTVEIARSPEDVFAYLSELDRHNEWQEEIVSAKIETEGPARVGSRVNEVRRMGSREMKVTWELTEYEPPRKVSFKGVDGPVRVKGSATVEPAGVGSRVTLQLDFTGHGIGVLLAPLARRQARKQAPKDQAKLKERLESGSS